MRPLLVPEKEKTMSFIELESGLEWINADRIVGMHYAADKISLMYLGANNAVVVSNINRDYAAGIMKDMVRKIHDGEDITQEWIDEWCQSGGSVEWARRKDDTDVRRT